MSTHRRTGAGDDTIVAVITPPGEGGVAALRVAGPMSLSVLRRCFTPEHGDNSSITPFLMRYGRFVDRDEESLDEVMAVFMPKGHSYTGLDQVEIFCHGGRHVVRRLLDELVGLGARPAEPGEFTKLAFLNGRIDLARAEAVAEVIAANTEASFEASREHLLGRYSSHVDELRNRLVGILAEVEASIDFSEEDIDPAQSEHLALLAHELTESISELLKTYDGGRIIHEGYRVAICGRPNAGKSSLFNLLLKQERALVHAKAGTTRDYLSEWIDLGGFAVNLIDTAGLRQGGGTVEKAGQSQAQKIIRSADLVLWLVDLSSRGWRKNLEIDTPTLDSSNIIIIGNKIDISERSKKELSEKYQVIVPVSCTTERGIPELKQLIVKRIEEKMPDLTSGLVVTSARHKEKLSRAVRQLKKAERKLKKGESPELTAFDLNQAKQALDEITGHVYTEDILGRIFSTFCVGK